MLMRGPNHEEIPQEGVFREVLHGKRFVFTDALATGWHPQRPVMVGAMEFANKSERTRYMDRHGTRQA
jgi:uncharacterized protein YndB with AHSA1/START domain